ncbi:MAG: diguanylate cyclase [Bacillota bacterium]
MNEKTHPKTAQADSLLIQNLVARFPMSCACFETVFDEQHKVANFVIIHVNEGFETILGIDKKALIGNTVADAFGSLNIQCVEDLFGLINETYHSENQTCEVKARVFGHVYKVSFLFITDIHLLVLLEDIHAMYFRRHYHRSIPRDVVETSFAKAQLFVPKNGPLQDEQTENADIGIEVMSLEGFKPLEIIKGTAESAEPYDAAFRDTLTGLYGRGFAMEALRMYVDSKVLPLSVALGNVNGLKTINESLGFRAGDDILIKIAQVLLDNCRADDVVTRWNDGEFLLLLPQASQMETQHIIKRLQTKLNAICNDAYCIVTFGYATSETECRTAENLISEAEKWINQKKLLINQSHRSSITRLLLSMLHEKNAETQEHSDRMASHCRWIAKKLRLSDDMVNDLILLSMLHDIGKIGIPDYILNKPGPLTAEERITINRHPEIGYRIAQTVPELKQVAAYILAHHERWDGTGYPKGMRGEGIPIASRIIAIVDAFDVIVTGRNYQPARTKEEAVAELKRCAGTQFDPNIVSVYMQLLADGQNHADGCVKQ